MTGKDFLREQVFPLDYKKSVSFLRFPDENDTNRCPYCGNIFVETIKDNILEFKCDCPGSKYEQSQVSALKKIEKEIKDAQEKYAILYKKIYDNVVNSGMKIAAKHYLEKKAERDAFDSEIESYAN